MKSLSGIWKKFRFFIFEDNSIWSWMFDIVFAFVLIKFIVYPLLGLLLSTTHPIVAVVSGSMEHDGSFEDWWSQHQEFYLKLGIEKEDFLECSFRNGFNTGDIMILMGKPPEEIDVGDIIVYQGSTDPIIHRVVKKWEEKGSFFYQTKGDHNSDSNFNERRIREDMLVGYSKNEKGSVAVLRIPFLGWIKIGFMKMLEFAGVI